MNRPGSIARTIVTATLLLFAPGASAHPDPTSHIERLSDRIEGGSETVQSRLRRGQLLLSENEHARALDDFEAVRRLAPESIVAEYYCAQALLGLGRAGQALSHIERFAEAVKHDPAPRIRAHRVLARIHTAMGRTDLASRDWEYVVRHSENLTPSDVYSWSESLAGDSTASLAAIAVGIDRLGPLQSLEERAYEIEMNSGRTAAAIARAERWHQTHPHNVFRLRDLARAYAAGGRHDDARRAWRKILAYTQTLAPERRSSAFERLAADARRDL